jgi:hypothetical protein
MVRAIAKALMYGAALCTISAAAAPQDAAPARRAFEIFAGPVHLDLYLKAERLAGIVSHPPGASRCADERRCGPEGLIASARASATPAAGPLAIARGEAASAFAPADVAVAIRRAGGKGKQNQSRLRVIALVNWETVYLIAATKAPVRGVASLRGRWVGVGEKASRLRVAASAVMAAAQLKPLRVRSAEVEGDAAVSLVRAGRLDAFFVVGPSLPPSVAALVKEGIARKVPLEPGVIAGLRGSGLGYEEVSELPEGEPDPAKALKTVAAPVLWLVDEKVPAGLVYRIARAAFDKRNAQELDAGPVDPSSVRLRRPAQGVNVPLHAGAVRYFAEAGGAGN